MGLILLSNSTIISEAIPKVCSLGIKMNSITIYGETPIGTIIGITSIENIPELLIIQNGTQKKLNINQEAPVKLAVVFDELLVIFQGTRMTVFNLFNDCKQISSAKHRQLETATYNDILLAEDMSNHIIYMYSCELIIIEFNLSYLTDTFWIKTNTLYNIHVIPLTPQLYYPEDMEIIGPNIYIQVDASFKYNGVDYTNQMKPLKIIYEINRVNKRNINEFIIPYRNYYIYKNYTNYQKSIIIAWYDGLLASHG